MSTRNSTSPLHKRHAPRIAYFALIAALAGTTSAQIFTDDFEGEAIDPETWGVGSTSSLGTQEINAGWAKFDTVVGDVNVRSGAVTHRHDFNPFTAPFQIVYNELYLLEDALPVNNSSFYGSIGRYVGDEGGAATGALASSFGVGPYPGAFGFQILKYSDGTWRLQILDMGDATDDGTDNRLLIQAQIQLTQAPTDLTLGIDGVNKTFYIEIAGATLGAVLTDALGTTIHSETVISGNITNFTEFGILVSGTTISRLSVGVFSGTNGATGPVIGELGAITVEDYNAPAVIGDSNPLYLGEFPIGDDHWTDTGDWLGYLYVEFAPWVYQPNLGNWLYVAEDTYDTGSGAWAYSPNN